MHIATTLTIKKRPPLRLDVLSSILVHFFWRRELQASSFCRELQFLNVFIAGDGWSALELWILFKELPPQFPLCRFMRYIWCTCNWNALKHMHFCNLWPLSEDTTHPWKLKVETYGEVYFTDFYWPSKRSSHKRTNPCACQQLHFRIWSRHKEKEELFVLIFHRGHKPFTQIPKLFKYMIRLGYIWLLSTGINLQIATVEWTPAPKS